MTELINAATGNAIVVKLDSALGYWVASETDSKGNHVWACSRRTRAAAVRAVKAREKTN